MRSATLNTLGVQRVPLVRLLKGIVVLGAIALVVERLWIMADLPLWLDETWSAMIATQSDWGSFWREAWLDCNPPLYYVLLKFWVAVAGDSNLALRVPSLVLTVGAAFAALMLVPRPSGDLARWTWAALMLFWIPGATLSMDARGYGLLLLLSTIASTLFARLYRNLTLPIAALWLMTCSLMFLTHYFAAALIAAQGLLLLYQHRTHIAKVWPAGLIALPALMWFMLHIPRLQQYARPDVIWYEPLRPESAILYGRYVLGDISGFSLPLTLIVLLVGLAFNIAKRHDTTDPTGTAPTIEPALWATAISAVIGFVLALIVGAIQASLTARYFIPLVPPAMLGLVLVALTSRKRELICCLLVALFLPVSVNLIGQQEAAQYRNTYGYERASDFVAQYHPTQLLFAWDHPAAKILDPGSLEKIGGYFLKRSGMKFEGKVLVLREQDNPNLEFDQAADGERPAIIWLFNTQRRSAAKHHPPILDQDPAWSCREYLQTNGVDSLGAVACIRNGDDDA